MKYLLLLTAFFMGVVVWGQSVNIPTMTLSGEGGTALGMVTTGPVSGTGEGGSFVAPALDVYTLPYEISTALEAVDIEDVAITVTRGKITISAEGNYECNIYDVTGRLVVMQRATGSVGFDMVGGLYIVAISRGGKVVCARKTLVK